MAGRAWAFAFRVEEARPLYFSTAPRPAGAAALGASLEFVVREPERRERLRHLARYLREALAAAGVAIPRGASQIVPVLLGENERALAVAQALQAVGFDVRAIRPPSVAPGTSRLRISVNVALAESTIDEFAAALAAAVKDSARCSAASL